jgi:peroxiredoxin
MTDPNDASTFVAIDTITYNGEFTTSDYATVANDYLFQKCKVALTGAQGKYVTIMASFYRKGDTQKCTYDYMWIDDVWFSAIQHCDAPVELSTTNVTATEATVSWEQMDGAAKYLLQVSTDPLYAEDSAFVFNDTLDVTSYIVTGLKSNTDYIWRVKTICTDDLGQSDFSQNSGFHTARTPFFVETFGAANLDADWSFATNPAALVIDSADVELTGTNSTSYGWRRVTTNAGIDGAHYAAVFYSSSSATTIDYDYYWMISPVISLNDSAKNAHLTFDIALTGCSASTTPSATPASEAQMADDYTFMVLLSEDGGKTWKKENILAIWNNTLPAGNQLRDIPFNPANIRFDLAKYAGKNIRVAFYREADTYKGSTPYTCAIHLDNIRVNYYDVVEDNAQACQYEDIDKLGFYIDGDIAEAGEQTLRRIEKAYDFDANTKGYRDSIYVLDVNYIGVTETILSDTICEGDTYTDVNFHGKERAGVYRRKMQSVEACDSLVTLYLYVTPRAYAEDELVSICPGETFTWHDKVYDRQGIYVDTTVSIAGCDSISTLVLSYYAAEDTIKAAIRVATDSLPYTYVNEQYPYAAGQKPIIIAEGTAVGQYTETAMVQGANCTAILILDVTVYDPHEGILNLDDENAGAQKVIIRGDMYIKTNKAWYNAAGQKVADPRK